MKINIINSILAINPNAVVCVSGNDVNQIEWLQGTNPIAKQTILDKQIELQEIENNKIEQQQTNKESALNKLKALGLTEEEVKSIL